MINSGSDAAGSLTARSQRRHKRIVHFGLPESILAETYHG